MRRVTIPAMKTDVIFLGAGASKSAGFPLNEELANKIIYDLPKRNLPEKIKQCDSFHLKKTWSKLAESFFRQGSFSVDEFCQQLQGRPTDVEEIKRMVRFVLWESASGWSKPDVGYRRLRPTLFINPITLNPRFAIINFNYDGLLGKMLADAVLERRRLTRAGIDGVGLAMRGT